MLYFTDFFEQSFIAKPINYVRSRPGYKDVRNLSIGLGAGSAALNMSKHSNDIKNVASKIAVSPFAQDIKQTASDIQSGTQKLVTKAKDYFLGGED